MGAALGAAREAVRKWEGRSYPTWACAHPLPGKKPRRKEVEEPARQRMHASCQAYATYTCRTPPKFHEELKSSFFSALDPP